MQREQHLIIYMNTMAIYHTTSKGSALRLPGLNQVVENFNTEIIPWFCDITSKTLRKQLKMRKQFKMPNTRLGKPEMTGYLQR